MADFDQFLTASLSNPVASSSQVSSGGIKKAPGFDEWIDALEHTESSGGVNLFNQRTGATGPLQVTPIAVKEVGGDYHRARQDHAYARGLGVKYAKKLWDEFNGDPSLVAAAYHTGPTKVRSLMRKAPAGQDVAAWVVSQLGPEGQGHNRKTLARFKGTVDYNPESGTFDNPNAPAIQPKTDFHDFGGMEQPKEEKSKVLEFLKGVGGEVGSLLDIGLGIITMPVSVGAQLSSTAINLATGESPNTAYQSGRKIGHKVSEALGNPVQRIFSMIDSKEIYEKAKTTQGMAWITEQVENADEWWHIRSQGRIPRGSLAMMVEVGTTGLMGKGFPDAVKSGVQSLRGALRERYGRPPAKTFEDFTQQDILRDPDAFVKVGLEEQAKADAARTRMEKVKAGAKVAGGAAVGAGAVYAADKLLNEPEEKQPTPIPTGDRTYLAEDESGLNQFGAPAAVLTVFGMRPRFERGRSLANRHEMAVKDPGGMWHPEAVERLAVPLRNRLRSEAENIGFPENAANGVNSGPAAEWSNRAIRNYLNKYAGTSRDPLKDVEIPFGEGVKRWEEVTDNIISGAKASDIVFPEIKGAKPGETIYEVTNKDSNSPVAYGALKSYLSHVGDYLRQNVPPEKLQQYDLVRAVKETAANDARVAKEMEKAAAASMKDLPVSIERTPSGWEEVPRGPRNQRGEIDMQTVKLMALVSTGALLGASLADADRRGWGALLGGGGAALMAALGRGSGQGRTPVQALDYGLGVISTRLRNISEPLRFRAVDYERRVLKNIHEAFDGVHPFLQALSKVPKEHIGKLNRAIIDNDPAALHAAFREIGNPKLVQGWQQTRKVLVGLGERWKDQGRIAGLLADYFPRLVKDSNGLMKALGNELGPELGKVIREADLDAVKARGTGLSQLEQSILINRTLQNWRRNSSQLNPAKARKLREVTDELVQYYATPTEALHSYISTVVRDLEKARFFGSELAEKKKGDVTYLDLDTSIGNVVRKELDAGRITQEGAAELQSIIKSRFTTGEQGAAPWIQDARSMANAGLLGNVVSAVTQMGDTVIPAVLHGLRPTFAAVIRNLTGNAKVDVKSFGLIDHIAEEFASHRTSQKALNSLFKWSGFAGIDRFGKNVLLGAALDKFQGWAKTEKGRARLAEKYADSLGPEFQQLVSDLRQGKRTDVVDSVLFAELAEAQPITRMEVPQGYLDLPNGRVLYMLKTFMIKQMDLARREGYNKIKQGKVAEGTAFLAKYGLALGVAGATTDMIKNWILGRDDPFEGKDIWMNVLKTYGLSEYFLAQAKKEGIGKAVWNAALPPVRMFEEIVKADPKAWSYVPIIGKVITDRAMEGGQKATDRKAVKNVVGLIDPEMELKHRRLQEGRDALYRQYQRGDKEGFKAGLQELRKEHKLTEKQVNAIRKNAKLPADVRKFKSLPLEQQADILRKSNASQRERLRPYANKKLQQKDYQ